MKTATYLLILPNRLLQKIFSINLRNYVIKKLFPYFDHTNVATILILSPRLFMISLILNQLDFTLGPPLATFRIFLYSLTVILLKSFLSRITQKWFTFNVWPFKGTNLFGGNETTPNATAVAQSLNTTANFTASVNTTTATNTTIGTSSIGLPLIMNEGSHLSLRGFFEL